MRISFVIPAYNEEEQLPRCLSSIERILKNSPCNIEVIVVDNASTDKTSDVARKYSFVRVVSESRKGLVRARQKGFGVSTGDIIANIDADTVLPPQWLNKVFSEFSQDEKLAALSGPFVYYDLPIFHRALTRLFYIGGYFSYRIYDYIFGSGAMLQGGNFVVRRTHLEQIGGFDTSIDFYGEDTDVARRISKVGKVKWTFKLPIYASGRRLAHEGVIITGARYAINYFHILFYKKPFTKTHVDIRTNV